MGHTLLKLCFKTPVFFAGNVRLISLSCGLQNVWAVDHQGGVVMRIGLGAPSPSQLNPAWVPVEGSTCAVGARFTSVAVAANDWMVIGSFLLSMLNALSPNALTGSSITGVGPGQQEQRLCPQRSY